MARGSVVDLIKGLATTIAGDLLVFHGTKSSGGGQTEGTVSVQAARAAGSELEARLFGAGKADEAAIGFAIAERSGLTLPQQVRLVTRLTEDLKLSMDELTALRQTVVQYDDNETRATFLRCIAELPEEAAAAFLELTGATSVPAAIRAFRKLESYLTRENFQKVLKVIQEKTGGLLERFNAADEEAAENIGRAGSWFRGFGARVRQRVAMETGEGDSPFAI